MVLLIWVKVVSEKLLFLGFILGFLCVIMGVLLGFIGIGGGVLIVLLLYYFFVDIKKVIGCVVVCGIVIVLFGLVGYVFVGW